MHFLHNCTDSVWTEALLPPKWYWFHHSKGHDWCWFPFFFIVSPPNLLTGGPSHSCSHTLIPPSAVLLDTLLPLPGVPRPLVSPIQIRFVLQGALSWGQQPDDFWLHRFCVFRFQAQIVSTSHFSPSHAPLCFLIELVGCMFLPNAIKILWRQAPRIYGVLHFSSTWNILFTDPLNILILYNGAGFIKRYVRSIELHKF